jgi:RHS repeat-associated protein
VGSDRPGYVAENRANEYRLLIPADAGTTPVRFQAGGQWVSFAAEGADGAPRVDGPVASIGGLGAGTRLEYQATGAGVKETIVLAAAPQGDTAHVFDLAASPGLTPRPAAGGGLGFVDATGEVVFVVPAPFMVDSSGTPAGYSDAVRFDLQDSGEGWRLTMTADHDWLTDPARVYPVRIDPTITAQPAAVDCWLNQADPATPFCGAGSSYVRVGVDGAGKRRRGLLRFGLDAIPANATVTSGQLSLHVDPAQTTRVAAAEYVARRVTRSWTGAATWNSYDGSRAWASPGGDYAGSTMPGISINGSTSGYRHFDLTGMVDDWVQGSQPNHGALVKQRFEDVDSAVGFYSSDASEQNRWPRLTVSYTEPTPPVFDQIGDRRFFGYDEHELTDRMTAKVNLANGNLLVSGTDLSIPGTGLAATVQRHYNSLSTGTDPSRLGPGWLLGDAPTVRLEFPSPGRVVFVGGSGYRVRFDRNAAGDYLRAEPGLDAELSFHAGSNTYRLVWHSKRVHVFNAAGQMIRSEDKQGNQIGYTYTAGGELDYLTDTQGRTIDFGYASGLLDTVTDVAGGRTLDYDYAQFGGDPTYRLAEVTLTGYGLGADTVNVGASTGFDYDAAGRLTAITDPLGNRTQISYDGTSRRVQTLTRVTAAAGEPDPTTTFSYPASDPGCPAGTSVTRVDGPRTEVTDVTTYCADTHHRVVKTVDANGHPRSTGYTANSNVATFNDSAGGTGLPFTNTWDTSDNLRQTGLPTGGTATAEYTDTTNPHLPTAVRDYAAEGFGAGPTWTYDYDDRGNLIEANNAAGVMFRYCYDGKGMLQRIDAPPVTVPLDTSTTTGCGTANQGTDTLFAYDTAGNLTEVDRPGPHGTQTFSHDPVGRVETMTDGRGVVAGYRYDALDRVTSVDYTQPAGGSLPGDTEIEYQWDANGNQLATVQDGNDTTYHYDELNRVVEVSTATPDWETEYSYDTASNLVGLDGSDEPDVAYSYDEVNRVTSVVDQKGRTTSFGYDNRDHRTSTVYPNGVTMRAAYDPSGRMACSYAHTGAAPGVGSDGCPAPSTSLLTFFGYDYTSPRTGNPDTLMRHAETDRTGDTTVYGYDPIGRLTQARTTGTGGEVRGYEYTMDGRGNVTRESATGSAVPDTTTSFGYDDAGELCWTAAGDHAPDCAAAPAGATGYGYDQAGNLTGSTDGLAAGYTLAGQTAQVTPPGGTAFTMAYAGATSDDRRQAGNLQMSSTPLGLAAQGPAATGTHSDWFVRDPDGTLVAMINRDQDAKDLYYLLDGLGSVAATTDNNGAVVTRYTYEPYGEQLTPDPALTDTNDDPVDRNPFRYAAGYYDIHTGMLKYGTRYYQPHLLRWTQSDPVAGNPADPMTLNPYTYVGCNPTNATDPSGRFLCDLLAGTAVATGAVSVASGIAGLFATGTIVGLPAGATLGAASVATGVSSLAATLSYNLVC